MTRYTLLNAIIEFVKHPYNASRDKRCDFQNCNEAIRSRCMYAVRANTFFFSTEYFCTYIYRHDIAYYVISVTILSTIFRIATYF